MEILEEHYHTNPGKFTYVCKVLVRDWPFFWRMKECVLTAGIEQTILLNTETEASCVTATLNGKEIGKTILARLQETELKYKVFEELASIADRKSAREASRLIKRILFRTGHDWLVPCPYGLMNFFGKLEWHWFNFTEDGIPREKQGLE